MTILREMNNVTLERHEILLDHTTSETTYFVSGNNGAEFGQFKTQAEAHTKWCQMVKLKQNTEVEETLEVLHNNLNDAYDKEPELLNELGFEAPFVAIGKRVAK